MGHCTLPAAQPAAQVTCAPEHAAMGHCTPAETITAEGTNLPAGSGTAPPVPTDYAADAIYGPSAMAMGRHHLSLHHGGKNFSMVMINIAEVNGFKADFSASLHTLIITARDVKGSIAFISDVLAHDDCNIATMSVSRKGKNDIACLVIEMDSGLKPITLQYLRSLGWITEIIYIPDIDR